MFMCCFQLSVPRSNLCCVCRGVWRGYLLMLLMLPPHHQSKELLHSILSDCYCPVLATNSNFHFGENAHSCCFASSSSHGSRPPCEARCWRVKRSGACLAAALLKPTVMMAVTNTAVLRQLQLSLTVILTVIKNSRR